MKVAISYACDLEDIPYTVSELLGNINENCVPHVEIDIQDAILYSNEKNISEALESIDQARIKLAKIDNRLMDYATILAGYSKTNTDLQMGINPSQVVEGTQEVVPQDILNAESENADSEKEANDQTS